MIFLQSLLGATIVACLLALCALGIRSRAHYLAALGAAYLAFIISLLVAFALQNADLGVLVSSAIPAFIEEPLRTIALALFVPARALQRSSNWISFILGYALFETLLKLSDFGLPLILSNTTDATIIAANLTLPLVPFSLHVLLGSVACRFRARGLNSSLLVCLLILIHAGHNYSVLAAPQPEDWPSVLIRTCWRSVLLLFAATVVWAGVIGKGRPSPGGTD